MKLIEVNNLKYSYDKKVNVIDGVSFCVESGKYISLIGHNGSGKSTIAKLLLGLLEPNENSIKAFGLELNSKNIHEIRKQIGIVFQNPDNQFVGSTVADDIAFGLENRCVPHEQMDKLINELTVYSGIDTNRIPYTFHRLDVSDFFNDCVEEVGMDMENKDIELNYSNLLEPGTRIIADPEQLKKVINNSNNLFIVHLVIFYQATRLWRRLKR